MNDKDSESKPKPTKRYSKRPTWQWMVIYFIFAVILYGLVYLIFFKSAGSTGGFSY